MNDPRTIRELLAKVAIVGVHTTEQARSLSPRTTEDVLLESILGALADAGLGPADLDGVTGGRSPSPSAATALPGYLAEEFGAPLRYYSTVDAASAAHGGNVLHACLAVAAGLVDTVAVIAGGVRGQSREAVIAELANAHGEFDTSWGSVVPSWFAMIARRHMHEYGTTPEQLAQVAVSTRQWAQLTPQAMMRTPITIEDVVGSRMISDPLRLLDCALVNDGAGAVVITSADRARDLARPAVSVLGAAEVYDRRGYVGVDHDWLTTGAETTGADSLAMAGLSTDDIDLLEMYDCFTITVIRELEEFGFCKKGEGGPFVADGRLGPGGALPTNTFGGGLSWGHRFSGMSHLIEAVRQLRGECGDRQVPGARTALVHSLGGPLAMNSTLIVGRR
jgi:acetyl-CoA acetyltransferase